MKKRKIALVCMGGVFHGAYVAGAIKALIQVYGIKRVDYAYGTSASAGTLAYYLSGQLFEGMKIWEDCVTRKEFFHLRLNKPLNLDYLIEHVLKKEVQLNIQKIKKSKTHFFIPLTQENGKKVLVSAKNSDFFRLLKASMSVPLICPPVKIKKKNYVDGTFSYPLPFNDQIKNADILIIILTKDPNEKEHEKKEQEEHSLLSLFLPKKLKKEFKEEVGCFNKELEKLENLKKTKKVILIYHPKKLPYHLLDNSKKAMRNLIKLGFKDAKKNLELKETFLNEKAL
jgi:predicted patatin/cPLA2 family phospholipase